MSVHSGLVICPEEGHHLAMHLIFQAQADGLTPRLEFGGSGGANCSAWAGTAG
ncbi:hypothetical protein [Deinococcus sp. 6GRE01]|uniref:hypothetical protein n=1 Tax=Deinococcus sp. 6GRE01 TaxID=2745873 RepID=UPI001E38E8DD|nr:hypothetical protein [Deinococcus sp. 6GRE01]MCD0155863.1 hypothetical protein [Deinococcus sp. 6GRE01]